jgi:hypothetical protein
MPAARFRTHRRGPAEAGLPATGRALGSGWPLGHASACRPETNRELFRDETFVGNTHGAAEDAELSSQIAPRGQPRARSEPPALNALPDRPIDLGSQWGPSGTIKLDGEGSHRAMVQPKLAILVLFYVQGSPNYSL